jgi:hypothetical protein
MRLKSSSRLTILALLIAFFPKDVSGTSKFGVIKSCQCQFKITNEEKISSWLINVSFPHFSLGKVGLACRTASKARGFGDYDRRRYHQKAAPTLALEPLSAFASTLKPSSRVRRLPAKGPDPEGSEANER